VTHKKRAMRVFANLAVSLDGRIADRNVPAKPLGTAYDRRIMKVIRSQADVVIMGAETLRVSKNPVKLRNKKNRFLVNAVITRSGEIDPEIAFWKDPNIIRFVFTCKNSYSKALNSSRDRAFIVVAGETEIDPKIVLATFKKAGFREILVEGGGQVIRAFSNAKCLDELYLTLTPWLIGGADNPSLIGGKALDRWRGLTLKSVKKVKNELYLHYKI